MNAALIISAICPELYASASLSIFIDMAMSEISAQYFGTLYQKAIALKACHMFTLSKRAMGAAGGISDMSEGGISLSFAVQNSGDNNLKQTNYGLQYLELVSICGIGISVTNPGYENE